MDRHQRRSVQILDKDYQVGCPEGEGESLRRAAALVDKNMRDIRKRGRVIGLDRVAIMAALNIAHELIQHLDGRSSGAQVDNLEGRLGALHDKIDAALSESERSLAVDKASKEDHYAEEEALALEADALV